MKSRSRIFWNVVICTAVLVCGIAWLPTVIAGTGKSTGGPDAFGYEWIDQDESGGPTPNFIDLDSVGKPLDFRDKDNDVNKDGGYDIVNLKMPFNFYGETMTGLLVSTNGYLSTNLAGNGRDLFNSCPIPAVPDRDGGARIYPFHDDLVSKGGGFYKFFKMSPVPNLGGMHEPCTVIMWNRAARSEDRFDFEVILFHKSGEIRYQYRDIFAAAGDRQTIGIQNSNASTGLNYACDSAGAVDDNSAISFYDSNPALNVVSPDKGKITAGTNVKIRWVASFPSPCSDVKIVLLQSGSSVFTITNQTPNDGTYKWNVPADLTVSGGYAIHIEDSVDGVPFDDSDQPFEVL